MDIDGNWWKGLTQLDLSRQFGEWGRPLGAMEKISCGSESKSCPVRQPRATKVAAQARKRNCLSHNLWEARTIESKDRSEYIRTTTFLWLHNAHHSWLTSFKMHIALDKAKVCQSDWQRCPFQTDTYLKIVGLVLECIFFGISFDLVPDAISTEPARRHLHPLLFSRTFCPFQQIIHRPN